MGWKWYSVKTLIRWEAFGKPTFIDKHYDEETTLVEERIVLIKARSLDEATIKGEKEANDYSSEYSNVYGQKIRQRYLKVCDAFELFDEPNQNGVEVFSSIERVSSKVKDSAIIGNKFGKEEAEKIFRKKRMKFLNAEFIRE
jgi:hypothetical protein